MANFKAALELYELAKAYSETSYSKELRWQAGLSPDQFSESDLLREGAWVILCSGFSERVIRSRFDYISLAFCDWESSEEILANSEACVSAARVVFRNVAKLRAIVGVAKHLSAHGFHRFKRETMDSPLSTLERLPFVGPITACHLAKNLGFEVAKPDRHLVRYCAQAGYTDVMTMCADLSRAVGDSIRVVDLVLWRYFASARVLPTSAAGTVAST